MENKNIIKRIMKGFSVFFFLICIGTFAVAQNTITRKRSSGQSQEQINNKNNGQHLNKKNQRGLSNNITAQKKRHQSPQKPVRNAYLSVTPSSVTLPANGGTRTFTVNANNAWSITTDTYSWGSLTRNGNQLTLTVNKNENSQRSDYFVLSSAGKTVTIHITQEGSEQNYSAMQYESSSQNYSATFNNIYMEHNVTINGETGMKINYDYNMNGRVGEEAIIYTFIYFSDGTPLTTYDVNYQSSEGYLFLYAKFIPTSNPRWNGSLFLPLRLINLSGSAQLYFQLVIWQMGSVLQKSNKIYFNYNR